MNTKNMKFVNGALVAALMTLGVGLTACSNDDVDDLKNRMNKVEQNFSSQQTIINNLQEGIYVKGVTPLTDGYVLTLSNGETLTIKNGEQGAAGKDGKDGKDGVDGKDGKDGDSFFKSIEVGTDAVVFTLADGAGIAITGASATRSGALILSVKPTGFEAQQGYAFALDIEADGSSYRTAYTPTFLIVEAEKIALGVIGLYPNMGVVTGGKYFQLYVVFFPDWTTSRGITWTSSDEKMATVSPSGIVAVVDNAPDGEFTITATTTNGKKASLTFKIVNGMLTIDTEQFHQQEEAQ